MFSELSLLETYLMITYLAKIPCLDSQSQICSHATIAGNPQIRPFVFETPGNILK